MFYENDGNLDVFTGKTACVVGYGSQGHAHAQNLKDSGVNVIVALHAGSKSKAIAEKDGFRVVSPAEGTKEADIIMVLIPDEKQKKVYDEEIFPNLTKGKALAFAHGFNIRFGQIKPPADIDVFMVAPKGPGHLVRRVFTKGSGVPCLIAVEQNASGHAKELALAWAKGIGALRAGAIETTFTEETETDLFGEQAVLCGGVTELIKAGFDTLVDAGYQPEIAYFECLHEMKLIVDLMYEGGFEAMRYSVSDTAEYGDYSCGRRVITEETRIAMKHILDDVQSGKFAKEWIEENETGRPFFNKIRESEKQHKIVETGKKLRSMMTFLNQEN